VPETSVSPVTEEEIRAALLAAGRIRVMWANPGLPHQIVLRKCQDSSHISVSCNCMRTDADHPGRPSSWVHEPIETRPRWEADEAQAVYRKHLEAADHA
jgi:hypothetical protein